MRKSGMFVRAIATLVILTFIGGQVYAKPQSLSNNKLAASYLSDPVLNPDRGIPGQNDVAGSTMPGAIGNGEPLRNLIKGIFPQKLELDAARYEDISRKIRLAIRTAVDRRIANSAAIDARLDAKDKDLVQTTITNLISFNAFLSKELYPFIAEVKGDPEEYLLGFPLDEFRRDEKCGIAVDFIDFLYSIYPTEIANLRLAQYVSHERTPEKTIIKDGVIDRSDHVRIYTKMQGAWYGDNEVLELKKDLRDFINFKLGIEVPVKKSGDKATVSTNGPPTKIDLTQLPSAFQENLKRYGLTAESMTMVEVVGGKPRALAAGENPLKNSVRLQLISSTTMLQALQASNYAGMAQVLEMKEGDFGKLADGAAVTVGRKALEFLAKAYDITIIIAGNEGKTRDGAPAMPLGYVINPGAKNGTYLYIGDSIEVTNGIKAGKSGSSSMMALFPVSVPFETDGYKISLWTNFSNGEGLAIDPVVAGENTFESIIGRLAQGRNLSLGELAKQYDVLTLDRHKNDEFIAEAKKLGFNIIHKSDGDPVPAILRAIFGIPDEKGKKLIVLSTGGANEHRMAQIIATLCGRAMMATTYGSTSSLKAEDTKESGTLRPARNWSEKDLAEFVEANKAIARVNAEMGLNIPLLPQTAEGLSSQIETENTLAKQLRGNAAVGIASITGAPVIDAGVLASYLKPVTYYTSIDGKDRARVSGFLVNEEGRLFIYETILRSDNTALTREAMIADNDYGMNPDIQRALFQGAPTIQTDAGQKYSVVQGVVALNVGELLNNIKDAVQVTENSTVITDRTRFVENTVDYLAHEAALSQNTDVKAAAQRILREVALSFNLKLASINDFYMARQEGKWGSMTVPAVNGRTDVYHQFQQLFRSAKEKNVGVLILELARSEMRYAAMDSNEFNAVSIASAIKQGYEGLVFSQGDHFQVNKEKFDKGGEEREKELKAIETLIRNAVLAGTYNIDLDPSTLVDEAALKKILEAETLFVDEYLKNHPELIEGLDSNGIKSVRRGLVDEIETDEIAFLSLEEKRMIESLYADMHKTTAQVTMRFMRYIRALEKDMGFPTNFHISTGIEERHIDNPQHKNNPSTVLGSRTLWDTVLSLSEFEGPSKISLQTGTMHGVGGEVDFGIYQRHLKFRDLVYVQHGASTLEKHDFDKMRQGNVGEVHLATEYQKMELDIVSRMMPQFGDEMAKYLIGMMGKDAKMDKKFRAMWNLAFGNMDLAASSIKPDDAKREEKLELYSKLAEGQSRKDKSVIINEILGDSMPKGLKGTLKDLVKELPGPFKRQLMNLPAEVRAAVDKALHDEFSMIFEKLGAVNTKETIEKIAPFNEQPVIMPPRPAALQNAVEVTKPAVPSVDLAVGASPAAVQSSIERTLTTDELKQMIAGNLPFNAEILKANLEKILAEHPDELFFAGIEDEIGEGQKAQMMPLYKAVDEIANLKDVNDKPLFPNLVVKRGSASSLITWVMGLHLEKKLKFSNTFIGARKSSVDREAYEHISGDGRAWIAAIDDSVAGDYLPVFEAITLNMMAYLNADIAAIKSFYDAISDKPIDPAALQDMLKNRIIYILPKATAFDTKQLRELYELAAQVYIAA